MATPVKKKIRRSKEPCYFCVNMKEPDYKDIEVLSKYLSSKGRLVSRMRTGVCQKHQRRVTREVQRARVLAMLPFAQRV